MTASGKLACHFCTTSPSPLSALIVTGTIVTRFTHYLPTAFPPGPWEPSQCPRIRDEIQVNPCCAQYQCYTTDIFKMPWSRLQTNGPGDMSSLRRHSTIDPTTFDLQSEQLALNDANHLGHDTADIVKSPSPLRNSFEPPQDARATPSTETPRSPALQEQPPNRQRFSMLRFRHASDPQISKTARDQSIAPRPPMPVGKLQSGLFVPARSPRQLINIFCSACHHHHSAP